MKKRILALMLIGTLIFQNVLWTAAEEIIIEEPTELAEELADSESDTELTEDSVYVEETEEISDLEIEAAELCDPEMEADDIVEDTDDVDLIFEETETVELDQINTGAASYSQITGTCGEDTKWHLEGGIMTISGTGPMKQYEYVGDDEEEEYQSDFPWEKYRNDIRKIIIEDGVTRITDGAFWGCENLVSVTIGNGVKTIQNDAFYYCDSLKEVKFGTALTSIGESAFNECTSLISAQLPDTLETIGAFAFDNCESLQEVYLGKSLKSIGESAFTCCSSLETITIPRTVTEIGKNAFDTCEGLLEVHFRGDAPQIGTEAFLDDDLEIYYPAGNTTWDVIVQRNKKYGAEELEWIAEDPIWSLEDGTLVISSWSKATQFESVEEIPWHEYAETIIRVELEDEATSLGDYALADCVNLKSVTIGNQVEYIGSHAFDNCTALSNVTISAGVQEIGERAFNYCIGLQEINVDDDNTVYKTVNGVLFDKKCETLIQYPAGRADSTYIIPETVETIGGFAFYNAVNLVKVEASDNVKIIGAHGFDNCTQLSDIVFGDNATYAPTATVDHAVTTGNGLYVISEYAFANCVSLKTIAIPEYVAGIWEGAFYNCTSLSELYFAGNPPVFGDKVFFHVNARGYYRTNNTKWKNISTNPQSYQYEGTITWTPWQDFWSVVNSSAYFGESNSGYYISQTDYNRLLSQVTDYTDYDNLTIGVKKNSDNILVFADRLNVNGTATGNIIEWSGSCYGLSVWSILVGKGIRKITDLRAGQSALHNIQMTDNDSVESAINYYFVQQNLSACNSYYNEFMKKNQSQQLAVLRQEAVKGLVEIGISWVSYDSSVPSGGHSVVGYGAEDGEWEYEIGGVSTKYTHRILIYDCSNPDEGDSANLYYNDDGIWCIPIWKCRSTNNTIGDNEPSNNAKLIDVTSSTNLLNAIDYHSGQVNASSSDVPVQLRAFDSAAFNVSWAGGSCTVNGARVSNVTGNGNINTYISESITKEGTEAEADVIAFLPSGTDKYTVTSSESGSAFALNDGTCKMSAVMNAPGSIELYTDGGVEIHADQPTDCQLYVVADEGDRTLSLPKVQVEASSIQNVSLSLDDEGIIVSGDDLSDLSISGSSRSRMVELAVSSETNEILLSETDGEFAAYVDSDQDGIYDEKVSEVIQEKSLCVHSYETVTDKGAACTETGHQYERCTYCGEKKSDSDITLPAEGHKFSKWTIASSATVFQPTTEKRSCSACGAIETRTTGTKLTPTITVNAESFPLKVKQSTTALQVTGLAEGDYIASWQSSNVRIVTVSEDGKIKAGKKTGKAVITITLASGLQKNVTVTVQKSSVKTKKISAVQKKLTMNKGDSIALQPVITPITSTQKVTYKSSDKKVVTVSANGMLKAKKKGKATITVKSGSKTVKCKVTVR